MKLIPSPILPQLPDDEFNTLKTSIQEIGIQVPILITEDATIIDGHERYRVIQDLGIKRFPMRVLGGLSEPQRREYAVRLNIERRHLTREQRRFLIEAELRCNPARTDRSIGDLVGADHKTVGKTRERLAATGEIPHLVDRRATNGKLFTHKPSIGVETTHAARVAGQLLTALPPDHDGGGLTLRDARKAAWAERYRHANDVPESDLPAHITIKNCDFRRLKVADESVDLILTDPPWSLHESAIHQPMGECFLRWLKPGGMLLCYCGNASLPMFLDAFRDAGLKYQWMLGCAKHHQNGNQPTKMQRGGRFLASLRPVMLYSKGKDFSIHKTPVDLFLSRRETDEHTHPLNWQQPLDEARYFVSHFAAPGTTIVDPFVGSGTNAAAVALEGQGRRFLGCDLDDLCVKIARRRVVETMSSLTTTP